MMFKCFHCSFYNMCSYGLNCIFNDHKDCSLLIRECENCRYGIKNNDGFITCYKNNIVKKLIPDNVSKHFGDDHNSTTFEFGDYPF